MSKEQDFHKLIEQQDAERKEDLWKRISSQVEFETDEAVSNSNNSLALVKGLNLNKKSIMIMSSILLFIVVLIIVTVVLIPKNKKGGDNFRYCEDGDYYVYESDLTLAQYAEQNNLDILYFDWYNEIDYLIKKQFRLNTSDEVVCLHEELIDINGVHLLIYITDDKTEFDFLNNFKDYCSSSIYINSVEVKWCYNIFESYAMFNYQGYNYYLQADEVFEQEYILDLVKELLK